jgi:chitinase
VGFYVEETDVPTVTASMEYLIRGARPPDASYALRNSGGYPSIMGGMFWNIDEDRSAGYAFSNVVGPLLHSFTVRPAPRSGAVLPDRADVFDLSMRMKTGQSPLMY